MATPRRNRSLEGFYFAYLTRSPSERDVYRPRNRPPLGRGFQEGGNRGYDCVALVLTGRYPDCLDEIDSREPPGTVKFHKVPRDHRRSIN